MTSINDVEKWLIRNIKNLTVRYDRETNLEKKISIGGRLRAFKDFLNLISNQIKPAQTNEKQ